MRNPPPWDNRLVDNGFHEHPCVAMTNSVCNSGRDSTRPPGPATDRYSDPHTWRVDESSHQALRRMRDAPVRRLPVVNGMGGHLVGAISTDDLVLLAQNVRAGADVASVVGFHAVGRVGGRERGIRQPVQVPRRGRSQRVSCRLSAGPARRRLREIHDYPGSGRLKGPSSFIPTFGGVTGTDPRYGNRSRKRTSWHSPR